MSRVAITDLVTGDVAESADVNATMTSWTSALGTGAVGANNFRPEGLDRRTLSAANAAIYSAGKGAAPYFSSSSSSGAVASVGAWTVISLGGTAMQVGPTAPGDAGDAIVVTASVQMDGDNNTLVAVTLQEADEPPAGWSNVGTALYFRTKRNNPTYTPQTIAYPLLHYLSKGVSARNYRLAFQTANGGGASNTVTFNNGTIYVEDFAK